MELVYAQMVAAAKLTVLNLGKFELWKIRIEQYFLMTYYALWEVIVNGDSPPSKRTIDGLEQSYHPTTAEEKLTRKNELKARGTLLMALPNEHQLMFNFYKNVESLMEAIKKRLQKLISQLEIHGETISQEDINLKLIRSLPSEWKTHTLIWRNKPDLETLSMDDLYNSLKINKTEVKWLSSSSQNSQNVAFVSSNSSVSINQAHGSNSVNTDSLKKMDLKLQMAMLNMRPKRFLMNTRKKVSANGFETIEFEKTKLECYNYHKRGHFARECKAPRKNMNREPVRRNVIVETTNANDLVAQDGFGYDWSDQAGDGPTNFALMAYTSLGFDSQVFDNQVNDKNKIGIGNHAVPHPYTGNFLPLKPDLILADVDEYVVSESITSVPALATNEAKTSESKPKSRKPSFAKVELVKPMEQVKSPREFIKQEEHRQAKHTRKNNQSPREYVMAVRNFKKFFRRKGRPVIQPREEKKSFWQMDDKKGKSDRKCFRCGFPNHLIGKCTKPP
nr:ribonuclease H-like domain-containing protein [Tanacetum cinerariifolium]